MKAKKYLITSEIYGEFGENMKITHFPIHYLATSIHYLATPVFKKALFYGGLLRSPLLKIYKDI